MENGAITEYIDVAQITLYVFWLFFALLIWHIQQEGRREGYPPESDLGGHYDKDSWLFLPTPKTFLLPHGHGEVSFPHANDRDMRPVPGTKIAAFSGAPYEPTSANPMLDSIGPGSWAERADRPDLTHEGDAKIVPMATAAGFSIAKGDVDPRGKRVVGYDSVVAGRITDVWVDKSEQVIRYLEIETEVGATPRNVLVPINFCTLQTPRDREQVFYVHAISGEQFASVPATRKRREVTFLEEDKIMAYFGSGLMYANERRRESVI
ncbi:MAG: photosynthetic reaction center subunit H [Ahrensia sp.]|nr:photosynthetic reaction center subunit H [Ahrensia sp.]